MWFNGIRDFDQLTFQIKQGLIALGSGVHLGSDLGRVSRSASSFPIPTPTSSSRSSGRSTV